MKFLSLVLAVTVLVASVAAGEAKTHEQIVENAKKFTVLVTKEGFLTGGRGSGVLIDARHVLTCAHMVDDDSDEFLVYTYPLGQVIKAHVEYTLVKDDMAMLVLDSSAPVHVLPVLQPVVHDGERVTVLGNALGSMKWYVTSGVISGTEGRYLLTDASIQHGNSGGPWLNEKGEVIAITNWGLENKEGKTFGISGGLAAKRIIQIRAQYEMFKKVMAALMGVAK